MSCWSMDACIDSCILQVALHVVFHSLFPFMPSLLFFILILSMKLTDLTLQPRQPPLFLFSTLMFEHERRSDDDHDLGHNDGQVVKRIPLPSASARPDESLRASSNARPPRTHVRPACRSSVTMMGPGIVTMLTLRKRCVNTIH